eukprot:7378083-Prymnesium_polylepis.1
MQYTARANTLSSAAAAAAAKTVAPPVVNPPSVPVTAIVQKNMGSYSFEREIAWQPQFSAQQQATL